MRGVVSVLARESVFCGAQFLYWQERLLTAETSVCTGERLCVLRKSISVLGRDSLDCGDQLLYWQAPRLLSAR